MASTFVHRSAHTSIGLGLVLLVSVLFGMGTAHAHNPNVEASVDCNGLVSYTVTSWPGPTAASRTNPNIGVSFSTNGGSSFTQLLHESHHRFNAANDFTFSDTFQLAEPFAETVIVRVQAEARWGDNAVPGDFREDTVRTKGPCPTTTSTTSSSTTSSTSTTTMPTSTTTTTTSGATTTTTITAATTTTTTAGGPTTTVAATTATTTPSTSVLGVQAQETASTTTTVASVVDATRRSGQLPFTGSDGSMTSVVVGLALMGGGAVLLRRRPVNGR